jgi:hypothetical protein
LVRVCSEFAGASTRARTSAGKRSALSQLRDGDVDAAVPWYPRHGRIAVSPDRDSAIGDTRTHRPRARPARRRRPDRSPDRPRRRTGHNPGSGCRSRARARHGPRPLTFEQCRSDSWTEWTTALAARTPAGPSGALRPVLRAFAVLSTELRRPRPRPEFELRPHQFDVLSHGLDQDFHIVCVERDNFVAVQRE